MNINMIYQYLSEFPTFVNDCLGPTVSTQDWRVSSVVYSLFQGKTDSWYVHVIMVRPEYHNTGVATSLINCVRAKVGIPLQTLRCNALHG